MIMFMMIEVMMLVSNLDYNLRSSFADINIVNHDSIILAADVR